MPRSGDDPASYNWSDEYFQVALREIRDFGFQQRTFVARPALVARQARDGYREESEFWGQAFDPAVYEVVEGRWDHEHCTVCRFRVEPGHTYWENAGGVVLLCDVCHDHVMTSH